MPRFAHLGLLLAAGLCLPAAAAAQRGPAQAESNLPADVLALACAPASSTALPPTPLRITGGQDAMARQTFAPGDLITVNAGTRNGIEVGQEFYARRLLTSERRKVGARAPAGLHTAGWIRIYAVDDTMALATITHACDSVQAGDYLEPFSLPTVPEPLATTAKAERDHYARVMTGGDQRRAFGKGDFLVIDRGRRGGVTPGARFVVYRDKRLAGNFLFELGEAVAVQVADDTATLQVTVARDALLEGDYVAMRREPPAP